VKLILGPWTHGQRSVSYAGDVDFGPAAPLDGNVAPDYTAMRTAWFDRHLRGLDAPEHLPSPVKIFVMGGGSGRRTAEGRLDHGGRWRDEMDWPLPDAQPTAFHLQGDGSLATMPSGRRADCMFLADPLNPVPTIGGAIASGEPLMVAGRLRPARNGGPVRRERAWPCACRSAGRAGVPDACAYLALGGHRTYQGQALGVVIGGGYRHHRQVD
jgi:predicted acyl esterase